MINGFHYKRFKNHWCRAVTSEVRISFETKADPEGGKG